MPSDASPLSSRTRQRSGDAGAHLPFDPVDRARSERHRFRVLEEDLARRDELEAEPRARGQGIDRERAVRLDGTGEVAVGAEDRVRCAGLLEFVRRTDGPRERALGRSDDLAARARGSDKDDDHGIGAGRLRVRSAQERDPRREALGQHGGVRRREGLGRDAGRSVRARHRIGVP